MSIFRTLGFLYDFTSVLKMCFDFGLFVSLQARDAQTSMEEKYRNELNAHVKLSSLYKVGHNARHLAGWSLG